MDCDLKPVDVRSTEGRLALTAYVWPDQEHRLERLRGALTLAQQTPPDVRRQGAADFVGGIELGNRRTTVLWHSVMWHSVMWQYLPASEQEQVSTMVEHLGERATVRDRFAHLFLEPTRRVAEGKHEFLVVLTTWPGGERRILGRAAPHGVPVTWQRDMI
jgi:hypothetical protein